MINKNNTLDLTHSDFGDIQQLNPNSSTNPHLNASQHTVLSYKSSNHHQIVVDPSKER